MSLQPSPLPAIVTMELLGLPLEEWHQYADPVHELVYLSKEDPAHAESVRKFEWIHTRVAEEVEARRKSPRDDLISYLVTEKIDGKLLDDGTIREIVWNIMGGGVDTTTALSSNAFLYLYQNPDKRKLLVENPDMMPKAREEFLRYFSPIQSLSRHATKEITVADQRVQPTERVLLAFAAANRDPEIFEKPDELILDRFPNRHIGFGAGRHRCIGSFLARMMFDTMMDEVLTRIPNYEVDIENSTPYTSISIVNGWVNMPITFTPGKLSGVDLIL